ncbi:LysR family transcriptional regulator [uncultured Tateyamaria sp.]|uniref:LysR family transcriptional regulator n=1 Tax=uncultured Tateyamaria sp. TaxID=455651 RepID=UPI002622CA62|nr:LysR family transcriptional regulator [uncultured Tateyamaria sp.]
MATLNYHHLRYFREVAREGHLGHAAARLNVSQSALSTQIKQLEQRLDQALFDRVGRTLVLTEAGRIALDHADRIFDAGDDLLATLSQNSTTRPPLRVGALSTLSRNFQLQFLRPLLGRADGNIVLKSGNTATLLAALETLALDVVLTTEVPPSGTSTIFAAQKLSEQVVGMHARPDLLRHGSIRAVLENAPLIVPTESVIRTGFENLAARLGVQPRIAADVDDMAMVRLLTREGAGVAIAPAVVLADEIAAGTVVTAPFDLGIVEPFYAVTLPRKYPHPALQDVLNT